MDGPPPPPPPHGANPKSGPEPGGYRKPTDLPDGPYDIFIIPPHSSGSGFIYLPSLQCHRNSFLAGVATALLAVVLYINVLPVLKTWFSTVVASGGIGVVMLVIGVGVVSWAFGRTQTDGGNPSPKAGSGPGRSNSHGPGGGPPPGGPHSAGGPGATGPNPSTGGGPQFQNFGGQYPGAGFGTPPNGFPGGGQYPGGQYPGNNQYHSGSQSQQSNAPPPPPPSPPRQPSPPPSSPPEPEPEPEPKPKPKSEPEPESKKPDWEKAREETRRKEDLRRKMDEFRKKREEEERKKKEEDEKRAQEEQAKRDKETREREFRQWKEKRAKERAEKEAAEKEAAEKAAKEKARQEAAARYAAAREAAAAKRAATEKTKSSPQTTTPSMASSQQRSQASSPEKKYASSPKRPPFPSAKTETEDDAYSFRPYDRPRSGVNRSNPTPSLFSESTYAPSRSTARTTPPPSRRGPYTTKDPDKVIINGVYSFNNAFMRTPIAQLVSGKGAVTDGLIMRITTEGMFVDDDVRGIAQREWDIKAWTMKMVEVWCPLNPSSNQSSARANPTKLNPFRFGTSHASKSPTSEESDAHLAGLLKTCKNQCRLGASSDSSGTTRNSGDSFYSTGSQNIDERNINAQTAESRGLHVVRASLRDQEGKKFVFVLQETEAWKVAVGLQRLRKGSQVRAMGVCGLPANETNAILSNLGY